MTRRCNPYVALMYFKLGKKIYEINTIGEPDSYLWNTGMSVRLGKRFFTNTRFSFYILIWEGADKLKYCNVCLMPYATQTCFRCDQMKGGDSYD